MKNSLWVEKYRPKSVTEYVFVDDRQKEQLNTGSKMGLFLIYCLAVMQVQVKLH
jgi:hypothetical protein